MTTFAIGEQDFLLDGAPFRVLSGALHYFRIHPDQWADRIHQAKLLGLNTVETYVPWNEHVPTPGLADFSGRLDLGHFLQLVADEGLYAIVRPGPFICAEWDNGGLPAWLFTEPGIGIRTSEPRYLAAIGAFFAELLPIVAKQQVGVGGPVIMVQVENEYGAYGADAAYLRQLVTMITDAGVTVPLFTCDQPTDQMLRDGGLPELLRTGTFGSRVPERLATLRAHQPTGPLMCAEFWDGWFDRWGAHHHLTDAAAQAAELDALLATGASVNLYMLCGGTNFGFTNGANDKGSYAPTVTSYDYDAPLSEDGFPTAKYAAFREVLGRYTTVPAGAPAERPAAPELTVTLDRQATWASVRDRLGPLTRHEQVPTSDAVGHYRGFTDYGVVVPTAGGVLVVDEVRDRAVVTLDDRPVGVLSREEGSRVLTLPPSRHGRLQLLVEDQGRVNYGPRLGEPKGLIGPVTLDGVPVTDWSVRAVDLDLDAVRATAVRVGEGALGGPAFALGEFSLDAPADLFLRLDGWTKGVAFVNGFHLGRYWSRGPQRTLYVPAPVTRAGSNELVIMELHGAAQVVARFVSAPDLGPTEE